MVSRRVAAAFGMSLEELLRGHQNQRAIARAAAMHINQQRYGMSQVELAQEFGCHQTTVLLALAKLRGEVARNARVAAVVESLT